jgi:hypothetical protein
VPGEATPKERSEAVNGLSLVTVEVLRVVRSRSAAWVAGEGSVTAHETVAAGRRLPA